MKNLRVVLLLGACLMFNAIASHPAWAQGTASVYVVHGIPGHDVSSSLDPALPVDVQVNGSICLLQGLKFGDIAGPFTIPAGSYNFTIALASTVAPCYNNSHNNALLTANGVPFASGENASVVAYLNAEGTPGVTKFDNDLSNPIANGNSRVIVQHAANAPAVDIHVARYTFYSPLKPATIPNLSNGQQTQADLPSERTWNYPTTEVTLTPTGQSSPLIGPYYFQLEPHSVYLIYAVGSLSTQSFTLISKVIPGV
jgi:hypothetical protein